MNLILMLGFDLNFMFILIPAIAIIGFVAVDIIFIKIFKKFKNAKILTETSDSLEDDEENYDETFESEDEDFFEEESEQPVKKEPKKKTISRCPSCGANVRNNSGKCEYCGKKF
ncbi:MAG: hypothetical protein E7374_01260 [Clostridiales bacterium]|nr:hypothetical protein [Clostridiales bacterium]